jgi:hypothetical protein
MMQPLPQVRSRRPERLEVADGTSGEGAGDDRGAPPQRRPGEPPPP